MGDVIHINAMLVIFSFMWMFILLLVKVMKVGLGRLLLL